MKLSITPEQLQASPELQQLAIWAVINGTNVTWESGVAEYDFDMAGEKYIQKEHMQLCLAAGVDIDGARVYSPVVPASVIDNKVPSSWAGAYKPDPDDPEAQVTKEWQEYAQVFEVEGGYLIRYAGPKTVNNGVRNPTNDELRAWISEFGDFTTWAEADAMIKAFAATQE